MRDPRHQYSLTHDGKDDTILANTESPETNELARQFRTRRGPVRQFLAQPGENPVRFRRT